MNAKYYLSTMLEQNLTLKLSVCAYYVKNARGPVTAQGHRAVRVLYRAAPTMKWGIRLHGYLRGPVALALPAGRLAMGLKVLGLYRPGIKPRSPSSSTS